MADALDPAGPRPNTTIKIEKTIRNAPAPDEEEMDVLSEQPRKSGRPKKGAQPEAESEESEDAVAAYLQDHTVKIHVDRVSPREYKGKPIAGMIEEYVPPITIEEIETDLRNRFGGGRYRIRALKNGRFVGARGLNIYGDPKLAENDEEAGPDFGEDFNPAAFSRETFPGGPPVVDDEITDLRKQIEKEKLKNALDEVKGRMGNNPGMSTPSIDPDRIRREEGERVRKEMETRREMDMMKSDMDSKLDRFMSGMKELLQSQKQVDPARDHDIVQLDAKVERFKTEIMANVQTNMSEIKSMLQSKPAPEKPDNMPMLFTAMIDGFSKMSSSGDSKIHAIAQAESAKTQAMMDSLKAISDAQMKVAQANNDKLLTVFQTQNPQGIGEMSKTVGAVRDMAEALGWAPGGGGGNDAAPTETPDLMTRVMGLVEKALPSLLAANSQKARQTGQQLNQNEIQSIITQQAQDAAKRIAVPMAEQMAAKRVNEILAQQAQQRAQAEQQAAQQAQQAAAKARAEQQVRNVQAAAAQAAAVPAPVAGNAPIPPAAPVVEEVVPMVVPIQEPIPVVIPEVPVNGSSMPSENEIEAEKSNIVNACMEVLMKEMKIRPRKPEWNEVAYDELPGDVVDQLVMVTDADGLLRVIQPYAKPEYVETMKNTFASDQRAVDWFVKGLNEMKEWYAEEGQPETEVQAQA